MIIPVGWLLALERIAPGALVGLVVAWFVAMRLARRHAGRAAAREADAHGLAGEDRANFLDWNLRQQRLRANAFVFPLAACLWAAGLGLGFASGLLATGP